MKLYCLRVVANATIILCLSVSFASFAAELPTGWSGALQWRQIGPFRAGWSTLAVGIPDQLDTYYFGAAGGGVWKTSDAGRTWAPLFDDQPAASIGALAIAPSDSRIIYVGTGQISSRYDIASGNGVYRSDDGGAHWRHLGLDDTRHIGAILVDPKQPERVLVAALGHAFGNNNERGVFRSDDGGKNWKKTLFVDDQTGAVDLVADPSQADVVFAATWQARFWPWLSYFTPTVGAGSAIYRSSDGGSSWNRLAGAGWPQGKLGRIGLAATRTGQGLRLYAIIDAQDGAGGLYRSDDGGVQWAQVNNNKAFANAYFSRVVVAPDSADTIYVMGRSIQKSIDGGKTFDIVKGAPGGDDYHDLWINPKHPERMVTASDQGTVVSVNGGASWSDWYNQPTGQFYHLATDNRTPYWIYSGQQDSGTVAIASRSDYGAISFRDWHPVGGDERDYDIPDPQDPEIVYGSGLGGHLARWDARTGLVQNIAPWPLSGYGQRPTAFQYRYTWITPIAVSQTPPYPLYQGAQVLFRSIDQGSNWEPISPDLSAAQTDAKLNCDGDLDPGAARACGYGVIFSIALKPGNNDEIWIGSDDGKLRLTRDAGKTWSDITPPGSAPWTKFSSLDVSALEPGTAYAAVDRHRDDDYRPRISRTHDFGKTWTEKTIAMPTGSFVSVVRADPVRRGLLYAGTDLGVWVSFDDGDRWQSLQRNLPPAWVRDLHVHGDDLIAATQGRALWVMDDIATLREIAEVDTKTNAYLFKPAPALRLRSSQNRDTPLPPETPLGSNPPNGAMIDYWLGRDAKRVTLEIKDADGRSVRRFASDDKAEHVPVNRYFAASWLKPPTALSTQAGIHRIVWNLRYRRPRAIEYEYSIGAVHGADTPILPEGALVLPGNYQLVLEVDGKPLRASLNVRPDPRRALDIEALRQALEFYRVLEAQLERATLAFGQLSSVRTQVDKLLKKQDKLPDNVRSALESFLDAGKTLMDGEGDSTSNLSAIGGVLGELAGAIEASDRAPTTPQRQLLQITSARLDRAVQRWNELQASDLPMLNSLLGGTGASALKVPAADRLELEDGGESKDLP
jgi:photosystem II stability/assembly factor-like uncharacterized protein